MAELAIPPESERVEGWRLHVLVEAGFPVALAEKLAFRTDVDLHKAVALLGCGCSAELAVAILA